MYHRHQWGIGEGAAGGRRSHQQNGGRPQSVPPLLPQRNNLVPPSIAATRNICRARCSMHYPLFRMGNASSTKAHIEMAQKTGALSLANSGLNSVPESLQKLQSNLRSLDLSNNKLSKSDSFPPWIGTFHMLKTLVLVNCEIDQLPEGIYSLKKLETLNISNNKIRNLSNRISELKNLKRLEVTNNRLEFLPDTLAECKQLEVLEASNNKLQQLPSTMGSGSGNIVEINVNRNHISDIGSQLNQCPRLKTLRLEENCLSITNNLKLLLVDSQVSLICLDGNLFTQKELDDLEEYQVYLERFTATKKKMY